MATRPMTVTRLDRYKDDCHVIVWSALTETDNDGEPLEMPGSNDRSIQFAGTFGSGGTILLEGSNDGTNWRTLNDPQGNPISKTAADLEAVMELTRYVRPRVSAGTGVNLTATMLVRRP